MKKKEKPSVIIERKYRWRNGVQIRNKQKLDVQAIGDEIARLNAERNQQLDAKELTEIAKDPSSPFHDAYPWDVDEAADERWHDISRLLLRSYTITVVRENKPDMVLPANSVVITRENHRKYTYGSTIELMDDEETRALILKQAILQLISFRRKYAALSELAIIFASIDKVAKKVG